MSAQGSTAYIGIGANLGDARKTFVAALERLHAKVCMSAPRTSALYQSAPVGGPAGQPEFLNAAIEIQTQRTALELLDELLQTETDFARTREVHWGPRTLDLDLLLFGPAQTIDNPPRLIVPHPRLTERAFVLAPMLDLAPDCPVPGTDGTIASFYHELPAAARAEVKRLSRSWD